MTEMCSMQWVTLDDIMDCFFFFSGGMWFIDCSCIKIYYKEACKEKSTYCLSCPDPTLSRGQWSSQISWASVCSGLAMRLV